jgi:hypothetical protein
MHTTNYYETFIEVAPDTKTESAREPAVKDAPTIAQLHYALIAEAPYTRTSDDVIFETYARRAGIPEDDWPAARAEYFATGRACLRSSPLGKTYGWGIHSDTEGRVAVYARESDDYARLAADPALTHTAAMRSSRA